MSNLISHSELLQRAAAYVTQQLKEHPKSHLQTILDEAGMRFNLSPIDTEGLSRLFSEDNKKA